MAAVITSVADTIAAVQAGPKGPRVGAIFDVNGTLLPRHTGNELSVDDLRGRDEDEVRALKQRLFVEEEAGRIRPQARDLVRAHIRMGHTVVLCSEASRYEIEPLAEDLGVEHMVHSRFDVDDGVITGKVDGEILRYAAKAKSVRAFASEHGVDLRRSYAYASRRQDIPLLSAVGKPYAVNPHQLLRDAAEVHGWPVVTLREPPETGLRSLLGTAGLLAGMNIGAGLGFALGLLTFDQQRGANIGIPLGNDLGLKLAGVKLRVRGEHNLRRARPAVFVANHQSSLDPIVAAALVRRDFTVVGKKEARYDPRLALMNLALRPAFVDRGNTKQAKASLNDAVQRIRAGTSILIAPEGTRTATPVVGRFKKGAFHMAMQAAVPIVPIVVRNAGELMWRRSPIVNPGTLDVCVLDPVDTTGWTPQSLDEHVAQVRQLFVDTLENWPEDGEAQ